MARRLSPSEDQLRLIAYCPACHTQYQPRDAEVVDECGAVHLLHFRCRRCTNFILTVVVEHPHGISATGMVTDFDRDDVRRFARVAPLTVDDCIAFADAFQNTERVHAWLTANENTNNREITNSPRSSDGATRRMTGS